MRVIPFDFHALGAPDSDLVTRAGKLRPGALYALCVYIGAELADGGDPRAREIVRARRFDDFPTRRCAKLIARLQLLRPAARETVLETVRCFLDVEERRALEG